jgi:hypothetical protein
MKPKNSLPIMSHDPNDRIMQAMRKYDPHFINYSIRQITDFPIASDNELLLHYLRGAAGPFIDLKVYAELGVGWQLKPAGFEDEESGLEAKKLTEKYFKKIDFYTTMIQHAVFYRVLGRSSIVKTYDKSGGFYYSPKEKVMGIDCINPMTLTDKSIREVMADTTSTKTYEQHAATVDRSDATVTLEADRVIYSTNNPMTRYSPYGNSDLMNSITDLRAIARFPHYRDRLGHKYANLFRVIEIDTEKIAESDYGKKIKEDVNEAQNYLDDTAQFYRQQEETGGTVAVYDWQKVIEASFAGKEVKLGEIEKSSLESLSFKQKVPMPLLMFSQYVNRDTLRTLAETFISMLEKGSRNFVHTPIIEGIANEYLEMKEINEGRLEVEYNPFLANNLLEAAQIISSVWPTGAFSRPDIREWLDKPILPNLGGDDWKKLGLKPYA